MKKNTKHIIGILGGMGPQAGVHLLNLLISLSVKEFGAKNDDDFPEILLDSISIPDFISNDTRKNAALEILKNRVIFLNKIKPSYLAIACNTAHILLDDLREISKSPFISIIEEVVSSVKRFELKKVGLLGTPVTIKSMLYQKSLERLDIECIEPTNIELKMLEKIIRSVIAGSCNCKDVEMLVTIAQNLKKRGTEGIILGCTELPLIFPKKQKFPVFDSLEILATSLLRKYYKSNGIKKI